MPEIIELGHEERGEGYTHLVRVLAADLTQAADNTAQEFTVLTVPKGAVVQGAAFLLETPFEDASDAAFDSTTISVGDEDSATRFIDGIQANVNGTEVLCSANAGAAAPYAYQAAKGITLTFGSMADKALEDLDVGKVTVLLNVSRLDRLANGSAG